MEPTSSGLKQGKEETQSKSKGDRKSKGKTQDRSKARKESAGGEHRRAGGGSLFVEEMQASSKGEMKDVGRTRPRKANERVTEERVNMKTEEELEAKEDSRSRPW